MTKQHLILVVGTGRSGTTWLGQILAKHPQIETRIEDSLSFKLATRGALDLRHAGRYAASLAALYSWRCLRAYPRHVADKSHPLIWLADEIARLVPRALFVGVERNPYATVASMLQHDGVRRWMEEWQRYPIPNPFLGITYENAASYGSMSMAERSALRWQAHHARMNDLAERLPHRVRVLQYEALVDDPAEQTAALWEWLGVDRITGRFGVKTMSRDRWRQELSGEEKREIEMITRVPPSGGWGEAVRQVVR
jgi:hypothetical protein